MPCRPDGLDAEADQPTYLECVAWTFVAGQAWVGRKVALVEVSPMALAVERMRVLMACIVG